MTKIGYSGPLFVAAVAVLDHLIYPLHGAALGARFERVSKLGDLTYASYLLHFPIQLAFVLILDRLGVSRDVFFSPLARIVFMGITFGLSWVVFHGFEMPVQKRIRALALRREPGSRQRAGNPGRPCEVVSTS
jgi:peptidoglycan/LPS O-acetylase OafA/YrhL